MVQNLRVCMAPNHPLRCNPCFQKTLNAWLHDHNYFGLVGVERLDRSWRYVHKYMKGWTLQMFPVWETPGRGPSLPFVRFPTLAANAPAINTMSRLY